MEMQGEMSPATVDLFTPDGVERLRAIKVVEEAPLELRQALLDELAGHMRSKRKCIDSPIGYLHVITRKAVDGSFVPTMADEVARVRRSHAEAALRAAPGAEGPLPSAALRVAASYASSPEERAAMRAKLLVQRDQIAARSMLMPSNTKGPERQHDE